jgi:hypothetical protein
VEPTGAPNLSILQPILASFENLDSTNKIIPGFLTGPHYERQKPIVNKIAQISPDSQIRFDL